MSSTRTAATWARSAAWTGSSSSAASSRLTLDGKDPDELTLSAIDAGAEDVDTPGLDDDDAHPLHRAARCRVGAGRRSRIRAIRSAAPRARLIPKTKIDLNEKDSLQTLKLLDRIEDLDDVQAVHTNAEILDEYAEKYEG